MTYPLKAYNIAACDPFTFDGYPEDNIWELVYAPNREAAIYHFTRLHGSEIPEYVDPLPEMDNEWQPKKLNNWWGAYSCHKMSVLREVGYTHDDDSMCEECGENWPYDKEGFCGECQNCPECGCACGKEE